MKHTPGPWTVIVHSDIYGGYVLMEQQGDEEDALTAHDDSNAPLIAAAPDLLESLEVCLQFICYANYDLDPNDAPVKEKAYSMARAAIAKATA